MGKAGNAGVIRSALRHRNFRWLLTGYAVSVAGDWVYGTALVVFLFQQTHSTGWVAAAAFVRLLPTAVLGPIGGVVADRYGRRRVAIIADIARALLMLGLAGATLATGSVLAALSITFLSGVMSTAGNPALHALVPSVVGERDLAASNSVMSALEHTAIVVGPVVGAVLLLLGSPQTAFALNGITFLVSALCLRSVRITEERTDPDEAVPSFGQRLAAGARATVSSGAGPVVAVLMAFTFMWGQALVLLVLVSDELLHTGTAGLGWLNAAIGVGGLAAAGLTSRLANDSRPGRTLLLSLFLAGISVAVLPVVTIPLVAYALMALNGAGGILLDVLAITLLQRSLATDVLGRVFGILDSLAVAALLLGSLVTTPLLHLAGLRTTLVISGVVLPIAMLAMIPRLSRLDAVAGERLRSLATKVDLLAELNLFDGASRQTLEALAGGLTETTAAAGDVILREGEEPDDFYVIASGTVDVLATPENGTTAVKLASLRDGDYFGEIGLLEGIPRTATVQATSACRLYRIGGRDFLDAVNQTPLVARTLLDGVINRMAQTRPSYQPVSAERGDQA